MSPATVSRARGRGLHRGLHVAHENAIDAGLEAMKDGCVFDAPDAPVLAWAASLEQLGAYLRDIVKARAAADVAEVIGGQP